MELNKKGVKFPAKMNLSFSKLLDSLEVRTKNCSPAEAKYLKKVLEKAAKDPALREGIEKKDIELHREIVDELMATVFPSALTENEIKCASYPWDFMPFYTSKRLEKYMVNSVQDFGMEKNTFNDDTLYISACTAILGMHFGMDMRGTKPFYLKFPDPKTGRMGHYRMAMNADFMSVIPTDKSIDITQEDFNELADNYYDIDLWKKKFPEESWIFSGFMIMNLMDLTMDWNINKLSKDLLNLSPDGIPILQNNIGELLKVNDLTMSFVKYVGNKFMQDGKNEGCFMLGGAKEMSGDQFLSPRIYNEIIENNRPIALPDIDRYAKKSKSLLAKNLHDAGLKSYYVQPIIYQDVKLGFLELGSPTINALNSTTSLMLEQIIPILAMAGNRMNEEYKNRIEAVIQEECTTIHPSVKWRFEEEANKHIASVDNGGDHQFTDLIFKDVFPLYGQLDISGSSTLRNKSVKNDLVSQLQSLRKILLKSQKVTPLPIYDELLYVIGKHIHLLETNMDAASEHDIQRFLNKEIEPILPRLSEINAGIAALVNTYNKSLNGELHTLYKERKAFDESVLQLNGVLADFIDKKQEEAQSMFPHYFERYKTDGVDFNMYIGESISPNKGYSQLMFKNLRLWQLMVMVEMERQFHTVRSSLKKNLNIASLVLAHRTPLAIHFRLDEKQFDVDGAYNARYEIIKKRIDKASIKGTSERITEVGKLVIVYTNDEDESEYLRYIQFLQNKNYFLKTAPELLTIEDLQGVSGLKAVRIGIDYEGKTKGSGVSMEEIIAEIER